MNKLSLAGAAVLCVAATAASAQPALETEQDKTLYALGMAVGANILQFGLSADELELVERGMADVVLGNERAVNLQDYSGQIQQLASDRASAVASAEKQASAAFLDQMAKEPGAERSATGVVFISMKEGSGPNPTASDTVRVHYHGTFRDGTVFDSSVDRGEPVSFPLNGVIACWTEGVQKIKVGGKAKLGCPSDTAYGDSGKGPIPGGAALVFEVELLGIE